MGLLLRDLQSNMYRFVGHHAFRVSIHSSAEFDCRAFFFTNGCFIAKRFYVTRLPVGFSSAAVQVILLLQSDLFLFMYSLIDHGNTRRVLPTQSNLELPVT